MEDKVIHRKISYDVVAAAIQVWKTLGFGFLEKVYENALAIELCNRNIPFEQQKPIKVNYQGMVVGEYIADIFVDNQIILELKCAKAINEIHVAQTINCLKATGLRLGLILNFGPDKMESKRVIL